MSSELIIQIAAIVLGAGGLGAFLQFKLGSRKQNLSDFEILISKYKELADNNEKKLVELEMREKVNLKRINELNTELIKLENKLTLFESSHQNIPLPIWLKDIEGKMLAVNKEYEKLILKPIGKTVEDYIGTYDHEIWQKEVADKFAEHDKKVIRLKRKLEFTEHWGTDGSLYEAEVLKYPRKVGNTVIGVGGVIRSLKRIGNADDK